MKFCDFLLSLGSGVECGKGAGAAHQNKNQNI